jgi:hypothetical protein
VASALLGGVAGYARAVRSVPLSAPRPALARAERAGQVATPQEALAVAFKADPGFARLTLYDDYRLQMNRVKHLKEWAVSIFPLPESFDFDHSPVGPLKVYMRNRVSP